MVATKRTKAIPVVRGSGNVFADLRFAEPEEELTRAKLASLVRQVIGRKRLTTVGAGALMGLDQSKVSALLDGRIGDFSSEQLTKLLSALE
jgi:predicted XRE-type DNA-binding protein